MKTSILLIVGLFSFQAFAKDVTMEALVRSENGYPHNENVVLTNLVSEDSFDGEHFKIVKGKSEEAVKFSEDKHLTFRAATAYYHLMKARTYFVEKVKSEYVANIPKMTIRIEHKNQFSELGHFAHDNLEPQFNNALTIPAGKGLESRGVKPWNMEIWFRPSKKVHISELRVNGSAQQEMKVLLAQFRDQTRMQSLNRFLSNVMVAWTKEQQPGAPGPFSQEALIRTVGSTLIIEAGYLLMDPITKALSRKWYWLDTALIPEIIYHEYAHAALSDHLVLSHSTAIIEGMADFFAGQIADSPKLATKIKKYNTYNGKNAKRKQEYMLQFEMQDYANTDFVFGMLWEMKKIVGQDQGTEFMYELRKKLTTNSSIRKELIEGILNTCDEMCTMPFNDKMRILKALNLKGL
jgi:hypothetical protein